MNVVAVLRVSTATQADDGFGLEVQRETVIRWAAGEGHRLVAILSDEAVSGTDGLDNRPALFKALTMLTAGDAAGLVVPRLDRLARDLIVQEQLIAEVRRSGAEVFSASLAESHYLYDDESDPSRRLIRQVLGAVSEYERRMIRLRMRNGRALKAAHGGFAYGSPAYGLRAVDGQLVSDEAEQAAIVRATELRRLGLSFREVADSLTAEGFRPKRAYKFHMEAVRRMLARTSEQGAE